MEKPVRARLEESAAKKRPSLKLLKPHASSTTAPKQVSILRKMVEIGIGAVLIPVFYFGFAPLGWLLRTVGRDPLARAWKTDAKCYRRPSPPLDLSRSFDQLF